MENPNFITARKQSLRRLCFHRCLSVHRGGTWAGTPQAGTPPGRYTPGQVHPLGPLGSTPPGQVPLAGTPRQVHPWAGTFPWAGTPPGHGACWDTVNKQVVRIPLECILVKSVALPFLKEYMLYNLLSTFTLLKRIFKLFLAFSGFNGLQSVKVKKCIKVA